MRKIRKKERKETTRKKGKERIKVRTNTIVNQSIQLERINEKLRKKVCFQNGWRADKIDSIEVIHKSEN